MLYQASGQPDAAARVLTDMLHTTPTPESYALAARLYVMFGNPRWRTRYGRKGGARSRMRRGGVHEPRNETRSQVTVSEWTEKRDHRETKQRSLVPNCGDPSP